MTADIYKTYLDAWNEYISLEEEFKNAKLVQRYLGYSDVATTLRYYVDVFPEDLEEAAEMLAER